MKEFEINIVVSNEDNKYTEDEIIDLLDDWCKQHDLTMGGSINEYTEPTRIGSLKESKEDP